MKTTFLKIQKATLFAMIFPIMTLPASCKGKSDVSSLDNTPNNKEAVASQKIDIHTAVLKNDIVAIKQYIAAKSDLDVKEEFGGSTPLISAALFGRTEIAKLLIDAGAKLNIQNNDGSTALITAAFFCRPEIATMLLNKKADKTIKNKYNQTAIETIQAPFAEAKPVYDMLGSMLSPMGLKLDYAHIEKTRPLIVNLLK